MKRAAVAIALVIVARAEPVAAGSSCGGGGGSSSGSSSGGGGGGGGSSSSSSSTPACVDDTDIVGYRQCTKFGTWGNNMRLPLVTIEFGTAVRTFSAPSGERTGNVEHEAESFSYRMVGAPSQAAAPHDTAVVATARIGVGFRRGLYVALDGELGGLAESNAGRVEMTSSGMFGTPRVAQQSALVSTGLAVAGVAGNVGRLALGAELAGGGRAVAYSYHSQYLACEQTETISVASPVLEARARAGLWLSPFVHVSATAGTSLIDRGAWIGGLQIGFASRAFGGR